MLFRRRARNLPLVAQGLYYLVTGAWPLLHYRSFEAITGKKTDSWLVKTVGVLITVIATTITYSSLKRRDSAETYLLSYTAALGLIAVDVYFTARRVIPRVYLLDAVGEVILLALIEMRRRSLGRKLS